MGLRLPALVAALGLLAGCASASGPGSASRSASGSMSGAVSPSALDDAARSALVGQVSAQGAFAHLQALQRIADRNGGTRVAGGPGYDASVDYVAQVLRDAGYQVSTPTYRATSGDDEDGDGGHGGHSDSGGNGPVLRQVVAQTRTGDPNRVVLAGAHLDSVQEGPGINDDGSGVATLLEIATHLGSSPTVRNAVRFAFWGSEEDDLQGSTGYLTGLDEADRARLLLYLNLDMAASPNAGYFVQGGAGRKASQTGPAGSASAAQVLADQLRRTGVIVETVPFTGDDDAAFVEAGIPTGGALTGDAKRKTAEQAKAWGGQVGEVFDRCYHQACDRIDNINRDALERYNRAFAGTIAYFATADGRLTN